MCIRDRDSLKEREEYIDYLNAEISKYIVRQMSGEKSVAGSKSMSSYYIIVGNIEPVSYTHLDVYKRQAQDRPIM